MKLKYEMTTMDIDGQLMAIPIDSGNSFRGILRINEITDDILKLLEKEITEEGIIVALLSEYEATEEQIKSAVHKVLDILREENLLEE